MVIARPPLAERPDCAPASNKETAATETCPIDIAREINRRCEPRLSTVEMIATGVAQSARDLRQSAPRRALGQRARSLPLALGCEGRAPGIR
jgi:hypothetical protein